MHQISYMCTKHDGVFFFQIFVRLKPVAEKEMYQLMKAFLLKPKDRQQLLQQLTPDYYLKGYWDKIEKT